jgi:hypothetical protein
MRGIYIYIYKSTTDDEVDAHLRAQCGEWRYSGWINPGHRRGRVGGGRGAGGAGPGPVQIVLLHRFEI